MRILFIYHDRPNYYAGPIVNARRLLPGLQKSGFEVHCLIFVIEGYSPSASYLESRGVHCHLQTFGHYTETQITFILQKISEIKPDVFVPNLSVAGWFAARWVRESGIPTIACHRSDDPFHWAMVEQFVVGKPEWAVTGLVCVSEGLCDKVAEREPQHTKLRVIPSGVPLYEKQSSHTGPLKLVYVGRLVNTQKRIYDLVDAFSLVMCTNDDVTATLIGDGSERQNLQEHIDRHALNGRIRLIGTVPSEKIQAELVQHHILVLLSDYEGTPGAVMDGMAAGLVPVCLDIPGGIRELVLHENTGLLVKDRKQSFVDAISRLDADPFLRKRLAANAKKHVAMKYSIGVAIYRWDAFFTELTKEVSHRHQIVVPRRYDLPATRPELESEDRRMSHLPLQKIKALTRLVKRKLQYLH